MAPPLNRATDGHSTPPLSPSTSSGSSHASSASSSAGSLLSSILQRDGTNLRASCHDSLLEHRDPVSKLDLVADRFEEDTMMLDDWGEVGHERPEGLHGKQILDIGQRYRISIPILPPSGYGIDASVVEEKGNDQVKKYDKLIGTA
jgi:hypothetical protein